jgi:D-glycero-D-manno-heptose 1,7-bisphosphate phosphatase
LSGAGRTAPAAQAVPVKLALFDRDGVLNVDKAYLYRPEDAEWMPDAREAVAWLNSRGYTVVVVTNQSGVARGYYTEADVQRFHTWMTGEFAKAGADIARFYYCPHLKDGVVPQYAVDCDCRKPKPGMVLAALRDFRARPEDCFLVGDSPRDIEAAEGAGVAGYLYGGGSLLAFVQTLVAARQKTSTKGSGM